MEYKKSAVYGRYDLAEGGKRRRPDGSRPCVTENGKPYAVVEFEKENKLLIRGEEMRLENIRKKQTLMVVKKVEFGVYLGTMKKNVCFCPKKQVPKGIGGGRSGRSISVPGFRRPSDRHHQGAEDLSWENLKLLKVADTGQVGAFLDWGLEKDLLLPFQGTDSEGEKGRSVSGEPLCGQERETVRHHEGV